MNFFNNTGCGGFDRNGCGCDPCNIILWIMILQCLCGCGGNNNGCGTSIDSCTLLILLLLCGCGNGCK